MQIAKAVKTKLIYCVIICIASFLCAPESHSQTSDQHSPSNNSFLTQSASENAGLPDEVFDENNFGFDFLLSANCKRATNRQLAFVKLGVAKVEQFLSTCSAATGGSHWCTELIRPNPASSAIFTCTYGTTQPHQLVHPDASTWKNAIYAVKLIQELEFSGVRVKQIYNWWRPEPYNQNVGGAKGRHPVATSIDVRMQTMSDMYRAHTFLCKWRAQGRIRAVGFYGGTALHFGVGDANGNTWGKSCD